MYFVFYVYRALLFASPFQTLLTSPPLSPSLHKELVMSVNRNPLPRFFYSPDFCLRNSDSIWLCWDGVDLVGASCGLYLRMSKWSRRVQLLNLYQKSDLVKLDILLNGQPVDAMVTIVHNLKTQRIGRELVDKLKKFIDSTSRNTTSR